MRALLREQWHTADLEVGCWKSTEADIETFHDNGASPFKSDPPDDLFEPDDGDSVAVQPGGHTVMFWVLVGLAALVFAPCVLVPIWAETQEIKEYERALAGVVAGFDTRLQQNNARMTAFLSDPLVNDRMVRRELNFRPEDEAIVEWSAYESSALLLKPPAITSDLEPDAFEDYPVWVVKVRAWLPNWPWSRLFAESPGRQMMLIMSAGLLLSAFLLYGGAYARKPTS